MAAALTCWGHVSRRLLLLSERTDHVTAIAGALEQLPPDARRIVLATGRLAGEGFDHPALDTLRLAMPVSWKGTLQQPISGGNHVRPSPVQ